MMDIGGYNLLKWTAPADGYAVRSVEDEPLEFWQDADGAMVTGGDEGFCRTETAATDKWLFADAQGNPEKPTALANVPEADGTDLSTPVRIVPAGGDAPPLSPSTTPGTFTVYRIGARCYRLLLARNVVLAEAQGGGMVCDFSDAALEWLAPREETHSDYSVDRPVTYAEGDPELPSELSSFDAECALAPTPSGIGGDIYPTFSQGGQTQWATDPNTGEITHRITTDNPSLYVRDYWTTYWSGNHWEREHHELYWATAADAAENVITALETEADTVARVFGLDSPPAEGTAFDMILLCKTYYWHQKVNATRHIGPPSKGTDVTVWEFSGRGYYNTKLSGYLTQIVPVPPAERSAA